MRTLYQAIIRCNKFHRDKLLKLYKEEIEMKRNYNTDDKEPEESNFKIPSEKEHLLQITDVNPLVEPGGENHEIQVVKFEVVGGDEEGRTLLCRINLDQTNTAFYYSRLFLKAIGEPYKGQFEIETDRWIGRQCYATVTHGKSKDNSKTYANIKEYNFNKPVEQYKPPVNNNPGVVTKPEEIVW